MFITSQHDMDFGKHHNTAMEARLRKFFFKGLTAPRVAGVQEFLGDNAMDSIVWACGLARTPDNELPPSIPRTTSFRRTLIKKRKNELGPFTWTKVKASKKGAMKRR